LTGTATTEVATPKRSQISQKSLDDIVNQIIARLKAVRPQLLEGAPMFLKSGHVDRVLADRRQLA
jgi:hypothetical protein